MPAVTTKYGNRIVHDELSNLTRIGSLSARGAWWRTKQGAILHECPPECGEYKTLIKPYAKGDYLHCPECMSRIKAPD